MKKASKILVLCCLALTMLFGIVLTACRDNEPEPQPPVDTTLKLNRTTAELDLYEEVQLSVTDAGEGTIAWSSSDNAVATVKDGLVKSVAAGVAIITATRGEKSGYCTVTVINSFTAPVITFGETEFVADKGEQTHVTASVRYKGNAVDYAGEIEWNLTEVYKFEDTDSGVVAFDLDEDKKGATVSFGAYGEAQLTASAVVWGIHVSGALDLRVINKNVEITSALQKNGENYAVTLNPIGVTYKDKRVSENSVDPQITVKENGAEASVTAVTWLPSVKNVAAFDGITGKITATEDGALDTDTLVGVYKGNCIKIDVSVERAEIEFEGDDKWIMELKDIPEANGEFPVKLSDLNNSLPNGAIVGDIQKVEIPYKRIDANNMITYTQQNIWKSFDADTQTVTLTPPVRAYNMGEMTAVVTTSKAIYTMPMGIYTLVISDADELDEFGKYTTYQWESEYIWDGYFVLDKDITYNTAQNLQTIGDDTRVFQPFIYAKKKAEVNGYTEHFLDEDCKINVTSWNSGFFGVFDGCGHVIDGLMIDASESEHKKYETDPIDPTCSELSGFIGKLGAASYGDTLRRGTIKNIVFTNAVHGGCSYQSASGAWKLKGTYDSSFLFSVSLGGAVQNVYIQSRLIGCNKGLLGGLPWMIQVTAMENVVADVHSEANWNGKNPLGQIANYAEGEYTYLRNLYTVSTGEGENRINGSINLSDGSIKAKDSTPETAFENMQTLGAYLAEKNLNVLAENGWDTDFWTTDENGAPVPLALTKIGLDAKSVQLDLHEKVQLTAKTTETGTVTWSSSNEAVATVTQNGLVASVSAGTAVITAEIGGYAARCTVTVVDSHTAPVLSVDTPNVQITQAGGSATVTASVTYKGQPIDESITYTWAKTSDNTNNQITFTQDGASITVVGGAYGSATIKVETTVWDQTISATVNVFVANPNITLTSALPESGDVHTLAMDMFDANGDVSTADAQITFKEGDTDVALSNLVWRMSEEGIVTVSGGTVTAVGGGTVTLIASYQGKSVTVEVTVRKEEKTLENRWTLELLDKIDDVDVNVADISSDVKGTVQSVVIEGYNYYNGDTYERTGTKDILKSAAENGTITLSPPYRYREGMGDTTVVITTTQGVYTMPMSIYTFVISDENELNKFGDYTTVQWERTNVNNYFWDGYFVLDRDITCTSEGGYTSFINAHLGSGTWLKYTVNGSEVDASNVGFRGMFDGRGHVISGMKIGKTDLRGGFIGILNGVANGRAFERGTIQNVSFVNMNHDGNNAGWQDYLYSVSTHGVVRNIYIQANFFENNGIMGHGAYATQDTVMKNIVISVDSMNSWCDYYNLFGWLYYSSDIQNLYAVAPQRNPNGNGAIKAVDGVTLNDSTPADAFASKMALGEYLADKNLYVTAANGWDMNFWTTDSYGAPIPKAIFENSEVSSINLSTVNVQTFDGFMPRVYAWNVSSDSPLTFASSNESVVTVSPEGLVAARGKGTATVTATAGGGTVSTISVTVTDTYAGAKGFYGYTAIASVEDLNKLGSADMGGKYVLSCDIDLNGRVGSIANNFRGVFDGNGYALKNGKSIVQSSDGDASKLSLFAGESKGTIKNMKVLGWKIEPNGDLTENCIAWSYPSIINNANQDCLVENIYVEITVGAQKTSQTANGIWGSAFVGGGYNSTVKNCIVNVTYDSDEFVGTATVLGADWGATLTNVYAVVSGADTDKVCDILSSGSHTNNYVSLHALQEAHGDAFAAGGVFTGAFWDSVLQALQA